MVVQAGYRVRGTIRGDASSDKVRHLVTLPEYTEGRLELVKADLLSDDGWADAMRGVSLVAHVASPAPAKQPKHEDDIIKPAVEGNVLPVAISC